MHIKIWTIIINLKNASVQQFEVFNPDEVNGVELFEKDILLSPEQRMTERKGITTTHNLWFDDNGDPFVPWGVFTR